MLFQSVNVNKNTVCRKSLPAAPAGTFKILSSLFLCNGRLNFLIIGLKFVNSNSR